MPDTGRRVRVLALAAVAYLVLALVVWWQVWSTHPTSTTTCGCGDSALFLWFFAWPAHALAHGLNPLHSTAMSHPGGVNLLANTSELALGVVLAPVTWMFGPVASMNVALTVAPALSALAMFVLARRWVSWAPAAFAAGLLYGFSPLVLVSLSDAHLMLGWAVVPPLVVACCDELLFGGRPPVFVGLVLGLLLVVQFLVGTEVLLLLGIAGGFAAVLLAAYGLRHRDAVRAGARRVGRGLAAAGAVTVVVLAYPTWYALAGPSHITGRVWPLIDVGLEGTNLHAFFWPTPVSAGFTLFTHRVGGYQGPTLSGQYVGLGMVAVAVVGLLVWRRDRRLWFFGAMTVISAVLSLGASRTVWLPWKLADGRPLLQDIIPSRFLVVIYLSLAVMLAVVVDRTYTAVLRRVGPVEATDWGWGRWAPSLVGLAVAGVALAPIAAYLSPTVPMVTRPVRPPTWFTTVAPGLPARSVLLVFPVPYQLIESAMAWQAVTDFPDAMVGGGGPGGVVQRTGAERAGAEAIGRASFSFTGQSLRPGDVAATRHALAAWGVTGVVLPDQPGLPAYDRVTSVPYTVAFVTAVVGRGPVRQAGSWVWKDIDRAPLAGPGPSPASVNACTPPGTEARLRPWSGSQPASWPWDDRSRLVSSPLVTAVGTPEGTHRPRPVKTTVQTVVSVLVVVVALVALVGQAVRGDRIVGVQTAPTAVHDAAVDDAFYNCINVQAHSLVRPGQTVTISTDNLADVVTMIKGFGSWVTVANRASDAQVILTLRDNVAGPDTCLGTQVVATTVGPHGATMVRVGTGAQVAGHGPPPAPPL